MILYSPVITPRVLYMAHWAGNWLFGMPLEVIQSVRDIPFGEPVLNYSELALTENSYHVMPAGLLAASDITPQDLRPLTGEGLPAFYGVDKGDHAFDILSAAFYLLSRYEEYLPGYEVDEYRRFSHRNSIAWQLGFLKRPLVDEWMCQLRHQLQLRFPGLVFCSHQCRIIPTYDVDVAWSYRDKGLLRNTAGWMRDVATGRLRQSTDRLAVLTGKTPDPFDIFEELDEYHIQHNLHPIFFFLLAARHQGYDRNINRSSNALQRLIHHKASRHEAGIHLSVAASKQIAAMTEEKLYLEQLTGESITRNRMHYLNFQLPDTYRQLITIGILEDFSMGYGTVNGFRAGTSFPFLWYDLPAGQMTSLTVHPFCWMDANSIFEQKDSPAKALQELKDMHEKVKAVEGEFVTICHNHLMGMDAIGREWWKMYHHFLQEHF